MNEQRGRVLVTIGIELSPEAEARLAAEAQAHGIAPEKYAGSLLQELGKVSIRIAFK